MERQELMAIAFRMSTGKSEGEIEVDEEVGSKIFSFMNNIPLNVIDEIKAAPALDVFPVTSTEIFGEKILKVDQLLLDVGAVLELSALDEDFLAIVAKEIRFRAPEERAIIRRQFTGVDAGTGANGARGRDGQTPGKAPRKNNGHRGEDGGSGGSGNAGETRHLPDIYVFTNAIKEIDRNDPPYFVDMGLIMPGIDGGDGGIGGDGGNGGNGGSGGDGVDSLIDCKGGPGDGGRGGNAGLGGRGGDAGNGGDGANVIYVASPDAMNLLSATKVVNRPGQAGRPGLGGRPGREGAGGPRGGRTFYCHGGRRGSDGVVPNPWTLGPGEEGEGGKKGSVSRVPVVSIDDLY